MTKISVIIPVYNVEKYLRECLDSVVNQTLRDIEIICVNDGSTDNSLEILKEYEKQDSRIKIIDKKNEGAGAARNLGLKSATGDYVIFFDSDDYMDITTLEKLYQNITDNNADISICKSYSFSNKNDKKKIDWALINKLVNNKTVFPPQEVNKYIFQFCVGWPWDKLYRKEFLLENKLQFQILKHTEDTSFVLLSLVCAHKISLIENSLIYHRISRKTSLSNSRKESPNCYYYALITLLEELKKRNLYKLYEQSFVNYCITFPLWHITTIDNSKAKSEMIKKLKLLLNKQLKIKQYNENYFYDKRAYHYVLQILKSKILQTIFSIRNDDRKTHKIINLLGIKIKIKKGLVKQCQK